MSASGSYEECFEFKRRIYENCGLPWQGGSLCYMQTTKNLNRENIKGKDKLFYMITTICNALS